MQHRRFIAGLTSVWAGLILQADPCTLKINDALQPIPLKQPQLSGEIGRRIHDLIYTNFMVLNLSDHFIEPFQTRPFTNQYHYIGIGKVIDAGSLFSAYTDDPIVAARTSGLIDDLLKTRDADGYIGAFKPEPEGRQNHLNWALHEQEYLLLGLIRNAQTTGHPTSLQYARELGDYIIRTFSKDPHPEEVCTAGLPEAFIALYRCTGDARYLQFAAEIRHGNSKAEIQCAALRTWKQTFETRPAHVYVMLARCYAQTELYRHDGTPALLDMSHYMRHELLRPGGGLNVAGSASDGEHFSYTQNGAGSIGESCVTAYLIRWLDSLMRLDGDLRYGDIMERTIYNALFAAQEPAGRKLRYFTALTGPRAYYSQDGFCCPGNYRRIVAELPQKIYYGSTNNTVSVNLFTPSRVALPFASDATASLIQETDYPNTGRVRFRIESAKEVTFTLQLRIPRWCPDATITIHSEPPASVTATTHHYAFQRTWKNGDTVVLDMPMRWRFIRGHSLQEGKAALMRGPIVYGLGTAQNAKVLAKFPNFSGVVIDPDSLGEPTPDPSIRPAGRSVQARARVEASGAPQVTVTFTEFIDPTLIATYVPLLDLSKTVEDELVCDCFQAN